MGEQKGERDHRIDFLRAVGIVLIILAHVDPPKWLMQIRSFDVVLMVFVNGISYRVSHKGEEYLRYLWKRCRRLLFPTYLFIGLYFVWLWIMRRLGANINITRDMLVNSLNLTGGIGYVWVMRIYFLMALISPPLLTELKKWGTKRYLCALGSGLVCYEVLMHFFADKVDHSHYFVKFILVYLLGYGAACALGICVSDLSKRQIGAIAVCFTAVLAVLAVRYQFAMTTTVKYPPRLYYLSYGISISLLLYLLADREWTKPMVTHPLCRWLSCNSMRLYFWHVVMLSFYKYDVIHFQHSYTLFLFVILGAAAATGLHNICETKWKQRKVCRSNNKD